MKVKFKNWECIIEWSLYLENNNIAIVLLDEMTKELVTFATTNTSEKTDWTKIQVKDWSENRGMWEALVNAGVIESEPVEKITSYFVQVKVGKLTKQAEEEFVGYMVLNYDAEFC
ncbi:hypothetical protein [Enterococcus cecorum]|uniref:hypothetical protein n=1 Tax=Enterococcus cecorum TaxID=44008 RepID=UPI002ACADF76|nr:hypothetical protein [Enterococcus cecorum]MDZ5503197.1 hypothetical protein [Enterococcus cecorum]MDZ5557050.1 hypothetical protein [Enterococcus cecorum]MDZ5559063.1 hypothetical protein [Enterococcus cecorum]MDZ5592005.1 hypothetical protein [Enterococcus cecorum]